MQCEGGYQCLEYAVVINRITTVLGLRCLCDLTPQDKIYLAVELIPTIILATDF